MEPGSFVGENDLLVKKSGKFASGKDLLMGKLLKSCQLENFAGGDISKLYWL